MFYKITRGAMTKFLVTGISLGFKCILAGLMNMIDGMQFWTPIFVYRHKTVLVSPWLCCIDK
jgi:hypothetical protein